ncbi:MAG TPA: PD-(D/E)XK nuclease family protein, partial [Clostridiales bacterium]|nr:PD-(D/E)XK nuclease family protein [Clostridiales bacterium]
AYAAVTSSTEQVFLSYHKIGAAGESLTPSDVIRSVIRCFGKTESGENKLAFQTAASLGPLYFAETKDSTFDTYAKASVSPQTAETAASLRAAIPEDARLAALDTATGARAYQIADRSLATRLFGQDMGLSASRVEIYYQCAFRYFCQYGLRAKPRKRAALDPMQSGTIIHYVLENIIKNCTMKSLISMSDLERKAEVERWLSTYAQEQMGGLQDKTLRFTYLYRRLAVTLNDLISRLTEEFANSSFYPVDFELTIGPKEGKDGIPAYTLPLPDGGTLTINGSVDRVDSYQKDGQTYIRIVDYKTGGKDFALSEVICYGLSMQMLIYLFAIEQNGKERYGNIVPSGILYYPAKRAIFSLNNRNEAPEDIKKEKQKKELGSGLFLMDPAILDAMEHREDSQMAFRFLPVGKAVKSGIKLQDKNGAPEKGLICSEDLKKLHE